MAAPNLASTSLTVVGKTVSYAVTASLAAALSNGASSGKVFKVTSVYCANVDGTNGATITLTHYNGTTDGRIAYTVPVQPDETQVLVSKEAPIYLEEGHSLRAQASAANDLELVITYEDIS